VIDSELFHRLRQFAIKWQVAIDETLETETSVIAFGSQHDRQVVLKVGKRANDDEWHSGEILGAFDGNGFVHAYEHVPGAVLLERITPGKSLVELSLKTSDEEATEILADVMSRMTLIEPGKYAERQTSNTERRGVPTVEDWGKGFARCVANGYQQLPPIPVDSAHKVFLQLCASQRKPRLLHGDLQHYNVLFDSERGWLAIDPKGVFGELEYEIAAVMRNPVECPELFLSRATIERRLKQFATRLNLDYERALRWTFAQAVLSAIWKIEDGYAIGETKPDLQLAEITQAMIPV
jgi:streptomycin 6-kinase